MRHDFLTFIYSMRKRRKLLQGAKYHVMARDPEDYVGTELEKNHVGTELETT